MAKKSYTMQIKINMDILDFTEKLLDTGKIVPGFEYVLLFSQLKQRIITFKRIIKMNDLSAFMDRFANLIVILINAYNDNRIPEHIFDEIYDYFHEIFTGKQTLNHLNTYIETNCELLEYVKTYM